MADKAAILATLEKFACQRPGMEPGNYGSYADYRAELRTVTRDLTHARTLLRAVRDSGITAEDILRAADGGRLDIRVDGDTVRIDYCTGQYFPTEYRKAVCRVLASALWDNYRDAGQYPMGGNGLRAHFRQEFGRAIASRYFQ